MIRHKHTFINHKKYMKKIIWTFLSIFVILIGFTSCSKDDNTHVSGISLDRQTLSLVKGETTRLKAVVTPSNASNQTVVWHSSNNLVAVVDQDGNVTATGSGTTEIIATAEDGKFQATCIVNVEVKVSSITLSETEVEIEKGESKTIMAIIHPDDVTEKELSWSSSNTNVVTIENGVIKAINGGTAFITVAASNGVQATCFVKVTVPVQSITISEDQLTLVVGQKYTLTTSILPNNASNKNTKWTSSNSDIVAVDKGQITAKSPGTAVITVITVNGNHIASCTITVRKSQNVDYNPYGDGQKW